MEKWLGKYSDYSYGIMRIVIGLLFACHGAQKLFGAFGGIGMPLNPMLYTAGIIEFGGGILVALGLWGGYAAFLSSGLMAFAYFIGHASHGFWPIVNKGELAVVYCFVFLYIAFRGSGTLSVDSIMGKGETR